VANSVAMRFCLSGVHRLLGVRPNCGHVSSGDILKIGECSVGRNCNGRAVGAITLLGQEPLFLQSGDASSKEIVPTCRLGGDRRLSAV
jgi:hypothetical protein